jgi:hypothetical protein
MTQSDSLEGPSRFLAPELLTRRRMLRRMAGLAAGAWTAGRIGDAFAADIMRGATAQMRGIKGATMCITANPPAIVRPAWNKRAAMPIGIMAEDIEWNKRRGTTSVPTIISLMDAYQGVDSLRINLWWRFLEPKQGEFDPEYVGFLRTLLAETQKRGIPTEVSIRQGGCPLWVYGESGWSDRLYEPAVAARLADTWRRVAKICHEYPVVQGYWPISEEYPHTKDVQNYLGYLEVVTKALRAAHPGCLVKPRPSISVLGGQDVGALVSQKGPQTICVGCGYYPTGWQWRITNPNPLTADSYNNLQSIRYGSSWELGGPNGIGEIGFRVAPGSTFGDPERLLGFERCMALAYDIDLLEYNIWCESYSFSDPRRYFPYLLAFRNALVERPRRPGIDLRLVNDKNLNYDHAPYKQTPEAEMSPTFRWLEEHGYRFTLAASEALPLLKGKPKASLNLSEVAGLPAEEQVAKVAKAVGGIKPASVVLPWAPVPGHRQSITGQPCVLEVEFPGAKGLCDAASLGRGQVQLYAPPGTRVRWRKPGAKDWGEGATPTESRISMLR